METLCPSVQSSAEAVRDQLTLGGILRAFLPLLLHLLKLSGHKLRVLWQLAACGTPALGANLFHCPHCQHRQWAPRSCGNRHCPLPGRQKLAMARQADTESLIDHLLPLRLHSIGGTEFPDASQPAQTLSALVRLRRTESAGV